MPQLYVITGPAGVGKSTISKKLAESSSKSALIEGDDIYHQVISSYSPAWKQGNHLKIFWKICIDTIKIYLNNNYDVVFNYIVTPENLELLKKEFYMFNIKFVVLLVDESTLLLRDSQREKDYQMGDRCIVLLNNFRCRNYCQNNILDTSDLSIDETVKLVECDNRFIL